MPRVYTIAPSIPFLDALAEGILDRYGDEPLILSDVLVLLPNRRSCRALQEAFLRQTKGKALLLPHVRPLGEAEEDALLFASPEGGLEVPPVISASRQRLLLARLIQQWMQHRQMVGQRVGETEGAIALDQATELAIQLASLLEEVQREQKAPENLEAIFPEELSRHWQEVLKFLHIVIQQWPEILAGEEKIDPGTYRNLIVQHYCTVWKQESPAYPIIAAGSTGSVPATAQLLSAITQLPEGMVVLPGLDVEMDTESWEQLTETHPQYGLRQLLERMQWSRAGVAPWPYGAATPEGEARVRLWSEVMRPAATGQRWQQAVLADSAFDGLTCLNAAHPREEASAIALIMRQTLETPTHRAALITHDRALARQVAAMLGLWGIAANDSAGAPLRTLPGAVFLNLIAQMAAEALAPLPLLSCLKHPLACAGQKPGVLSHRVRALEKDRLRGIRPAPGFDGLYQALAGSRHGEEHRSWLKQLEGLLSPLLTLMEQPAVPLHTLLLTHIAVAEQLAATDVLSGEERLFSGEEGDALRRFLDEVLEASHGAQGGEQKIAPAEYPGVLEVLMEGHSYRPAYGFHPRLFILSPQEARLQQFECVILGGLQEGSWPMTVSADPWMSRPMRGSFGLPLPERQIGQAAHDFVQLASAPAVFLTRSQKQGGTMVLPSRWLLRLEALLSFAGKEEKLSPAQPWLSWAEQLNHAGVFAPQPEPLPKPPLAARPRTLSMTHIETLMRDPYGVYARKILGLKRLEPLDKDPSGMELGNFVHEALEVAEAKMQEIQDETRREAVLLEAGREVLAKQHLPAATEALWWPRFERIATWVAEEERKRRADIRHCYSEQEGSWTFESAGGAFTLTAKADRIEEHRDGSLVIVDYKTGTTPAVTDVLKGLSPQLTLEAVIASKGGFPGIKAAKGEQGVEYWKLSGKEEGGEKRSASGAKNPFSPVLMEQAEEGVKALIAWFDNPAAPYVCCPEEKDAPRYNDYEHLERADEWQEG